MFKNIYNWLKSFLISLLLVTILFYTTSKISSYTYGRYFMQLVLLVLCATLVKEVVDNFLKQTNK
jgi:VIT1/CCC1 family predicted Fe2+/Mn2+ transporter